LTQTAHPDCKEFFAGKTNPSYIDHHITGQRVRISLTNIGWRDSPAACAPQMPVHARP
jgi:hypothetical protein